MKGKSWFDGNVCCAIVVSVLLYAYTPRLVLFSRVRDTRAQTNRGSVATVHFHLLKYFFSFLLCKTTQTGRIHWRSCKAITKIITRRVGVVVRILIFCCIWECTFFSKSDSSEAIVLCSVEVGKMTTKFVCNFSYLLIFFLSKCTYA